MTSQMMPELRRMISFNAILLRHWELFVLWKQSGYAVSATLAFILFSNRLFLCTMRQTIRFISYVWAGCLGGISYEIHGKSGGAACQLRA